VQRLAVAWRGAAERLPAAATVVAAVGDPRAAWAAEAAPYTVLVRVHGCAVSRDGAGCPACGGLLSQAGSGRDRCGQCGWSLPVPTVQAQREGHEIRLGGLGSSCRIRLVVAAGARAEDAALRLEVAGVACAVVHPLHQAIRRAGGHRGERGVDLFADYTSFQQARRLIGKRG